jgi:carbohydrate diacid regulator
LNKAGVAGLPEALNEARIALDFTRPNRAAMRFADIDLAEALVHRADKALLHLIPQWIRSAHRTGRDQDLLQTVVCFAEASLNVKETARRLGVHTNTVYFRLNQIHKRSGVDPRTFAGASLLLTSLRLLESQAAGLHHS